MRTPIALWILMISTAALSVPTDLEKLLQTGSCEQCDLRGVDLSNRVINGVRISGSDFRGANLSGAKLSFRSVHSSDFTDANLSGTTLTVGDGGLHDSKFYRCDLTGARLVLYRCYHTQFKQVRMTNSLIAATQVVRYCNFEDSDLDRSEIRGWLYSQHFIRTSLREVKLELKRSTEGMSLPQVQFQASDLSAATVTSPKYQDIRFDAATKLDGASLNGMRCHGGSLGHCLDENGMPRALP